jgi:glycerol-1-phosphate dehydrogenase [NAD(P)+]
MTATLAAALELAKDTREVMIAPGALEQLNAMLKRNFGDSPVFLVADENTFAAAGEATVSLLASQGRPLAGQYIFPGQPRLHPDIDHVRRLVELQAPMPSIPLAVGSGVINDLTKLSAHRIGRPYACVATAASMDGYTAFAAAITHDGVKKVDPCPAPRAVLADTDVLAAAPDGMSASGFADLLGKYTAISDWMIADALGIEALEPISSGWMRQGLPEWARRADGIATRDAEAVRDLAEGLMVAGLAMQISSSTRAASGSEHLFSHLWEMQGLSHEGESVSHGFQVGMGTLASSSLLHWLLARGLEDAPIDVQVWPGDTQLEADIRRMHRDPAQADQAVKESLAKHPSQDQLFERLLRAQRVWPDLRHDLLDWCPPPEILQGWLAAAGCPTRPEQIGLTLARLRDSFALARQVRTRYTVLDLAVETGLLGPALESLFSDQGYWRDGRKG